MNIVSNLIFHCNNCDANRVFVTFLESTADAPSNRLLNVQDAQLSQRDRAAGCVIGFAKSRRLEQGDNILGTL